MQSTVVQRARFHLTQNLMLREPVQMKSPLSNSSARRSAELAGNPVSSGTAKPNEQARWTRVADLNTPQQYHRVRRRGGQDLHGGRV